MRDATQPVGTSFMRRQLFFLLAILLCAKAEPAVACSRLDSPPSNEELFAKASTVFVGHVIRVEEADAISVNEWLAFPPWVRSEQPSKKTLESLRPIPAVKATFRVVEVFKGQPPAYGKIRAPVGNYCSGPVLLVGSDQVFFLYDSDLIRSSDETRPAFNWPNQVGDDGWAGSRLLEKLRQLSKIEVK
jgi:hypothetical protein